MSNLLSQASLVMIPSGYKEDVVYSQIPTDGSGDLSFTRASNGTRVNSAGLVEVCPWNLVEYSEDFSNAYWPKSDTTITANAIAAPNGTTTADKLIATATNANHLINKAGAIPVISGQSYTFSLYAKAAEYSFVRVQLQAANFPESWANFNLSNGTIGLTTGVSGTIESVGNGWYRCSITQTATGTGNSGLQPFVLDSNRGSSSPSYTGDGTSGIYIWGAQLNIGSTAKPYFPTTDRLNVPRLTYQNGGGGCPSLLLEKQSTNLCLWSNAMATSPWTTYNGTSTDNDAISPDGTQNATKVVMGAGDSATIRQTISGLTNGQPYTFTLYIKQGSGVTAFLDISDTASTVNITPTNEWVRYTYTANWNTSLNFVDIELRGTSGSAFCYIWGAQLEAGSYATSVINTTSSSATRVADACFKTGISALFGTNQGTFFIDFVYYGSEQFCYIFDVTDASNVNRFLMYDSNGSGLFYFYDNGYSVIDAYQFTKGQRYKIAVKYNSSGTIWYVNGTLRATGTVSFAHQMAQIYLGIRYSFTDNTGMTVNESIVFPTALSGTELIALTTI